MAKDVLTAIDQSVALRSRSLLGDWMRSNHDAFKSRLDAHVPNWTVLTELFAEAGLTDRYGNKPKPESARQLWMRIKKEMAQKAAAKSRAPTSPRPVQTATPGRPPADRPDIRALLSPAPPPDDEISDDEFFRPITKLP